MLYGRYKFNLRNCRTVFQGGCTFSFLLAMFGESIEQPWWYNHGLCMDVCRCGRWLWGLWRGGACGEGCFSPSG